MQQVYGIRLHTVVPIILNRNCAGGALSVNRYYAISHSTLDDSFFYLMSNIVFGRYTPVFTLPRFDNVFLKPDAPSLLSSALPLCVRMEHQIILQSYLVELHNVDICS